MWHDNRATIDLIGFKRYANAIANLVLNARLLPLTIGIYGEWGSGKSSVMYLTEQCLLQEENVVCITFNGWMFQGYDDTKAALMTKIIETLRDELNLIGETQEKVKQLLKKVDWFRATALALKHLVPLAVNYATATPLAVPLPTVDDLASLKKTDVSDQSAIQTIEQFRKDFESLLEEAKVKTLVVFVDDLDRCLPAVVVDVLEAIKLFLSVKRTAFVIGADENTIKQAIAIRYPQETDIENISKIYLEKIVQVPVHLHPLNEAETETYLNLLFAELHQEQADCEKLAGIAAENRAKSPLEIALDFEVIKTSLGDNFKSEYSSDLNLAAKIAPIICRHERGNPRQIKRFLNTLLLRQQLATAYGLNLNVQVLAKLMILEYYHTDRFKQLFEWQLAGDGIANELMALEQQVIQPIEGETDEKEIDEKKQVVDLSGDIKKGWLDNNDVKRWLQMTPHLGNENLEQYFFVARERLAKYGFQSSDLSRNARQILSLLLHEDDIQREHGKTQALQLPETELENLFSTAVGKISQLPDPARFIAILCSIAEQKQGLIPIILKGLERVPDDGLPVSVPNRVAGLALQAPTYQASVAAFLERLENSSNRRLVQAAKRTLASIRDKK